MKIIRGKNCNNDRRIRSRPPIPRFSGFRPQNSPFLRFSSRFPSRSQQDKPHGLSCRSVGRSRIHADGIRSAIGDRRISQRKKMCSRHLRPQIAASALPIWCAKMSQGKNAPSKVPETPFFGAKNPRKPENWTLRGRIKMRH